MGWTADFTSEGNSKEVLVELLTFIEMQAPQIEIPARSLSGAAGAIAGPIPSLHGRPQPQLRRSGLRPMTEMVWQISVQCNELVDLEDPATVVDDDVGRIGFLSFLCLFTWGHQQPRLP